MITVDDIIRLPVFDNIWLACPCEHYLSRTVSNMGTLDHEPFTKSYDLFSPEEFIFTSLGFAKEQPELAHEAILELLEHDVAAIAIKPVALHSLDPELAHESFKRGIPIFFYEGRFTERIIAAAMNLIDQDAVESERTRSIDRLLAPSNEQAVREELFAIAGVTGATIQCLAMKPTVNDETALRALQKLAQDTLENYETRWDDVHRTFTCRYKDLILGFVSFKRPPLKAIAISDADLEKCITTARPLICGISQELWLSEGDLALRQAMAALATAESEGTETVRWTGLRFDAFRSAASTDRLFTRSAELMKALLNDYDQEHDSDLLATARAFAEAYGEVKVTAEALFQHANTVRYRLKQIKDVLGLNECSDRELAALVMLMFLV